LFAPVSGAYDDASEEDGIRKTPWSRSDVQGSAATSLPSMAPAQ